MIHIDGIASSFRHNFPRRFAGGRRRRRLVVAGLLVESLEIAFAVEKMPEPQRFRRHAGKLPGMPASLRLGRMATADGGRSAAVAAAATAAAPRAAPRI